MSSSAEKDDQSQERTRFPVQRCLEIALLSVGLVICGVAIAGDPENLPFDSEGFE